MFDLFGPYGYLQDFKALEAPPPSNPWSGQGRCKGRPLSRHREATGAGEKRKAAARMKKASRRRNRHR